jgi:hypothetical protein
MIEGLLDNLKGGMVGDLMSKFGLDEEKAGGVFSAAGEATKEEMTKNVAQGGLSSVMSLFSNKENGDSENSMLSGLQDNFIGKITSKLGIDPAMASGIAGSIIPKITGMITSKNEETDEADSSSIMSMFGGDTGGIGDSIKKGLGGFFK